MGKTYAEKKERARALAIDWQRRAGETVKSWQECAEESAHFSRIGRRFGLLREFRENYII